MTLNEITFLEHDSLNERIVSKTEFLEYIKYDNY